MNHLFSIPEDNVSVDHLLCVPEEYVSDEPFVRYS